MFSNLKIDKTQFYIKNVVCRKFKKKGHYTNKFPSLHDDDSKKIETIVVHVQDNRNKESDSEYSDLSFMMIVFDKSPITTTICLNQLTDSVPKTRILLDNNSTTDIL